MPGIYGAVSTKPEQDVKAMTQVMCLYSHYVEDSLFYDDKLGASRVHLGEIGELGSPLSNQQAIGNQIYIWVEGEAYNTAEVAELLGIKSNGLADLLLKAETMGRLDKCLNKLDAYFCAAIYDAGKQKVRLFSDRYGMRMLYWYHRNGVFAWGSSVKAILAVEDVDKTLNNSSFNCFMDLGYLTGEQTWFKHIKLIKPATIIEYNLACDSCNQNYYWTWAEVKPSNLSFDQAMDELGERFIQAVNRRFDPNERIGFSLSGGLDSRAIFAAVRHLYPEYKGYAYTFGVSGCDDIEIAERVVAKSGWQHEIFCFMQDNWFESRFARVWNTDGMMNIMHMHGSEFLEGVKEHADVTLNGYLGDANFGGSYMEKVAATDCRINHEIAMQYCGRYGVGYDEPYYDVDHHDIYQLMQRGRRFINGGSVNGLVRIEQRKPFFDNDVMQLIYSLPDAYRVNNKLYSAMLQKYFPNFFRDIPWQKTGKPAAPTKRSNIPRRAVNKLIRIIKRSLKTKSTKSYTNYPEWIRDPEVAAKLKDLLAPDGAQYTKLTDEDLQTRYLTPHLNSRMVNNDEKILRAVTVELYLRKVFE